jgi:hypothetical protein
MQREKIAQAVSACLEACYGADDPLAQLAAFVNELKMDPHWSQAEVWAVETQSLKLLNLLVSRPRKKADLADSEGVATGCTAPDGKN